MSAATGLPYTRVYRDRGAPTPDSVRMRVRLAEFVKGLSNEDRFNIRRDLALYGGIATKAGRTDYWALLELFEEGAIDDVLDAITYIYGSLSNQSVNQTRWRGLVARAFEQENLGYCVDEECGVHQLVDQEFQQSKRSAIAALDHPLLASASAALADSFRHLDAHPADTKAAVRSIFEAVEILALQIATGKDRLTKNLAIMSLPPACKPHYSQHPTEEAVTANMFQSLGDWVEALHDYRHGKPEALPARPSEELAVYAISTGCAHLRWLAPCAIAIQEARAKKAG